jgi:hypothetical protein
MLAVALAAAGGVGLIWRRDRRALTLLLFPVAFLALMAAQRVNFTRNVLVLLPVVAVLAAVAVQTLGTRARWAWVTGLLLVAATLQPGLAAIGARRPPPVDSRLLAARWLAQAAGPRSETVVASELAWPVTGPGTSRVTTIDTDRIAPLTLHMDGYDRLIVDSSFDVDATPAGLLRREHMVPGAPAGARVVISPEVRIFRVEAPIGAELSAWLQTPGATVAPEARYGDGPPARARGARRCSEDRGKGAGGEGAGGGCWARSRASRWLLDPAELGRLRTDLVTMEAEIQSPWPGQRCTFEAGGWRSGDVCALQSAGRAFTVRVQAPVSALRAAGGFTLHVSDVHPLANDGADARPPRAGLIVRNLRVL